MNDEILRKMRAARVSAIRAKLAAAACVLLCARAAAQENNSAIFQLARQKSLEESGKVYPDLRNENSQLWQIAHQIAMEARDPKSPTHAILAKADAPMIIAKMAVIEMIANSRNLGVDARNRPNYKVRANAWGADQCENHDEPGVEHQTPRGLHLCAPHEHAGV